MDYLEEIEKLRREKVNLSMKLDDANFSISVAKSVKRDLRERVEKLEQERDEAQRAIVVKQGETRLLWAIVKIVEAENRRFQEACQLVYQAHFDENGPVSVEEALTAVSNALNFKHNIEEDEDNGR